MNKGAGESVVATELADRVEYNIQRAGTGSGGGFQFSGTRLSALPVPDLGPFKERLVTLARRAIAIAESLGDIIDKGALADSREAVASWNTKRAKLIYVQEELDWLVYQIVGLIGPELAPIAQKDVEMNLGERPFEIGRCRLHPSESTVVGTEGHLLVQNPPHEWPSDYQQAVEARIDATAISRHLRLLESEEFKHRWSTPDLLGVLRRLREAHLLKRIEARFVSVEVLSRTTLLSNIDETDRSLVSLASESVPFLDALCYSAQGLKLRAEWRSVWEAQRREHRGDPPAKQVPSKYSTKHFREARYYRLRGKLDIPKERFISYPGCESDEDGEPVYGWAGWDHLQRAQALAILYMNRKTEEGWPNERLIPILAGLYELLPWLKQWHNDEPDPEYGVLMGDYYEQFIEGERNALGLTKDEVVGWRPSKRDQGRRKTGRKKTAAKTSRKQSDD